MVQTLFRFLGNLHDAPALLLGDRTRLHVLDDVADSALAVGVVGLKFGRAADGLAIEGMAHYRFDGDHDRLLHLVADHAPMADFPSTANRSGRFPLNRRRRSRRGAWRASHALGLLGWDLAHF